ncbi:MAG: sodium-dependent transporter [Deltaproteobacteria bacterium]|nr:sodium-dependent transporter [Deltaproteobacteria bacterium]
MSETQRPHWGSKMGFILAAAGSAIGLGNIWRFPYITQQNGGGIFVIVYLLAVLFIGLPVMLGEITIGRHTQRNPVGAYGRIAPGWRFVGALGIISGLGILSYYSVVAGWTIGYAVKSIGGSLDPNGFGAFLGDWRQQIGYLAAFSLLTSFVVASGVQAGIERMARVLMPLLFLLMLGLIIRGLTLPTAGAGLKFYLMPDVDKLTTKTFLFAVGQAFFSLSLGMGAMLTYGAYLKKEDNLVTCAVAVVALDTLIALMAGFLIFPVIGHGLHKGGPSLVFVTMIAQFSHMTGGTVTAILFFVLLALAALTSTVSLMEVFISYLIDEWHMRRLSAVVLTGTLSFALGVPSALSLGAVPSLTHIIHGKGFLDIFDFAFGNLALTLGGLLMCIVLIYRWGFRHAADEVLGSSPKFRPFAQTWKILLQYVAPVAIAGLLIYCLVTGTGLS